VAAGLARGDDLVAAAQAAKAYVAGAMRHGVNVGHGHQPLDHFWRV
jgi:hydroxymethylpyrimidine/phosphomethylpyrimidine kinase